MYKLTRLGHVKVIGPPVATRSNTSSTNAITNLSIPATMTAMGESITVEPGDPPKHVDYKQNSNQWGLPLTYPRPTKHSNIQQPYPSTLIYPTESRMDTQGLPDLLSHDAMLKTGATAWRVRASTPL